MPITPENVPDVVPVSSSTTDEAEQEEPTYFSDESDEEEEYKDSNNGEDEERFQTPEPEQKSKENTVTKHEFKPQRVYLGDAVRSRSRQPLSYGIGLINTVTDLVENHVNFSPYSRCRSNSDPTSQDVLTRVDEEEKLSTSCESKANDLSAISKQEPDVSRFLRNKWEGPAEPQTAMDKLIGMGFANRGTNNCLLRKHSNHLPSVINELLETHGEGYQAV